MRVGALLHSRREALAALLAASATLPLTSRPLPALAVPAPPPQKMSYTVVPTGTIVEKEQRLKEVEKLLKADPDDPYVFGEKAQLEFDIKALRSNRAFAQALSRDVSSGKARYAQSVRVGVPDMEAELTFWTRGPFLKILY